VTMARPADIRLSTSRLLTAAGLLVAAMLLLGPGSPPEVAMAHSGCSPNGDDTFTPGDPGEPPPGGVTVGPGEPCPETEPVAVPPAEELPPPPRCDPCAKERDRSATISSTGSGGTPTASAASAPGVERLPYTGLNREKTALMLSGLGLIAIGMGLAIRRRTLRV
jgi:LPXTG-motif cell wall-anchored protein